MQWGGVNIGQEHVVQGKYWTGICIGVNLGRNM